MSPATALLIQHGVPMVLAGLSQLQRKRALEQMHTDGVLTDEQLKSYMNQSVEKLIKEDPIGNQD